ncbi:hypothetical protein [Rhizobium ruizarguesonis]|uniref:hypothetical protein n=1 Tax=Rhizobium ruizarguesonis TaxID=2081791 RepID=UPI001FD0FFF2|nr:hypothetical protein [Rhizobium ruizarguesonis]
MIAHATEPLRHRLDGLNDFLPIEPTECRAQSDLIDAAFIISVAVGLLLAFANPLSAAFAGAVTKALAG